MNGDVLEMGVLKFYEKHKQAIYNSVVFLFCFLGLWYGIRGYLYYRPMGPIQNNEELLGRLFTPFVIAVIRFVIVTLLGVFVAMIVISRSMKRFKIKDFEIEFQELADVQVKQINQSHFLSTALERSRYFVQQVNGSPDIPYKECVQKILVEYEDFFDRELQISINTQIVEYVSDSVLFDKPEFTRLANRIVDETNVEKKFVYKQKIFGTTNFLMAERKEAGISYIILIESTEHIFGDYDKEIVKSILEFGRVICDTVSLMP